MKKSLAALFSLLLLLLTTTAAFAHAGHHHLFGIVKSVAADRLVVHDTTGSDSTVLLTSETSYKRGDADATLADVVEGIRVVIDLSADGQRAEIVKLGTR